MTYAPLGTPRFSVFPAADGDTLIIPAPRSPFGMAFMSVWLVAWTAGGVAELNRFLDTREPSLILSLCVLALCWTYVALALTWMSFGSEALRVVGGNLEVRQTMLGLSRRRLFRGQELRGFAPASPRPVLASRRLAPLPFGIGGQQGSIEFVYGGRSQKIAHGMDLAEAMQIIAWLLKRLPDMQRP